MDECKIRVTSGWDQIFVESRDAQVEERQQNQDIAQGRRARQPPSSFRRAVEQSVVMPTFLALPMTTRSGPGASDRMRRANDSLTPRM